MLGAGPEVTQWEGEMALLASEARPGTPCTEGSKSCLGKKGTAHYNCTREAPKSALGVERHLFQLPSPGTDNSGNPEIVQGIALPFAKSVTGHQGVLH